jgi:hypothetical protein
LTEFCRRFLAELPQPEAAAVGAAAAEVDGYGWPW